MKFVVGILVLLWGLIFYTQMEVSARDAQADTASLTVKAAWSKPYREFHEIIMRLEKKMARNHVSAFMILKGMNTVATVRLDENAFHALKKADDIFLTYRKGLQTCIESRQGKGQPSPSYERFAWFLDGYVRLVVESIREYEDPPYVNGVREKKLTTEQIMYAYSRLAMAYLGSKARRDESATDKAVESAIGNIATEVFHLDMSVPFNSQELVDKGPRSQPIFRQLASGENQVDIEFGLAPLNQILGEQKAETSCQVSRTPEKL